MPVPDPRTGYATIWIISCFLFISIAVGGGFLLMYMILPESDSTYWLPVAGVTLVCLPWLFWFCTCFYRIVSRLCGFRIGGGGGGGASAGFNGSRGGGGGGQGSVVNSTRGRNVNSNHGSVNNNNNNNNNAAAQAGQNGDNGPERKDSGNSTASRESEIPLTSSMAP